MATTSKNTGTAPKAGEQAEYYRLLKEAPIEEFAKYAGVSIDEAVNMRIAEAIKAVPPKLDVTVRPIEPKGNLVGFASIKFYDGFVVDDFKILQGEKGFFIGMPSKLDKNSKTGYKDTARIVNAEFRATLTKEVITEYYAAVEKLQTLAAAVKNKQPIKQQLVSGTAQAVKDNAARPAPAKGSKVKNAEL